MTEMSDSAIPSVVSMTSDQSKMEPIEFKNGDQSDPQM